METLNSDGGPIEMPTADPTTGGKTFNKGVSGGITFLFP